MPCPLPPSRRIRTGETSPLQAEAFDHTLPSWSTDRHFGGGRGRAGTRSRTSHSSGNSRAPTPRGTSRRVSRRRFQPFEQPPCRIAVNGEEGQRQSGPFTTGYEASSRAQRAGRDSNPQRPD